MPSRPRRVSERAVQPYGHTFVVRLLANGDWASLYQDVRRGIQRGAFGAATLERFLDQAISDAPTRLALRGRIVSGRSWKRRVADGSPLSALEVERMTQVAEVVRETRRIYAGDALAAERFLTTPHRRLGKAAPILLAASSGGSPAVRELLSRLEEGAPA